MGNQIKLIASDLDGTLLLNDAQECSQELYGLVEALSARGILFVPASGRQYASLRRLFAPVHDKIMYLCENGALVMKGEVPLFQKGFERELAMEIGQAICGIPDCHLMVCCPKSSYTMASSEEFAAYMREEIGYEIGTVEHLEEIAEPILKVSVSMQPHLRAGIKQKLQPLFAALGRLRHGIFCWLKAQAKLSAITFSLAAIGLLLLRVPYAPLWAVVIALVDAFPILGTGSVLLPWSLVSFLQGDPMLAFGLLGLYAAAAVTRTVLEPRLVGKQLGLDPLVTLIALYAGFKLFGLPGMIFAPVAAVTVTQLMELTR